MLMQWVVCLREVFHFHFTSSPRGVRKPDIFVCESTMCNLLYGKSLQGRVRKIGRDKDRNTLRPSDSNGHGLLGLAEFVHFFPSLGVSICYELKALYREMSPFEYPFTLAT